MKRKNILLEEYKEGNKICLQYEAFRRQGISFFFLVQGAIATILFSKDANPTFDLKVSLSLIAIVVSFLAYNNDRRLMAYYLNYTERLKQIEKKLRMKLLTDGSEENENFKYTIKNSYFYQGIPMPILFAWIVYIFYTLYLKVC